jgi:ketosteroid isomerase-like protein
MSQKNVETVREAVDAMNARDIDRYLTCCTDDVQLLPPTSAIEGAFDGPDGIRRYFADIEDVAPDFRLDLASIEAVDDRRVIGFLRVTFSGRSSGVPGDLPVTTVYDLADGRISRIQVFLDREQALKAVGLQE